jgi:hypothetical protein
MKMDNKVKATISKALQDSLPKNLVFHPLNTENSIMEIDYDEICKDIGKALSINGYQIL